MAAPMILMLLCKHGKLYVEQVMALRHLWCQLGIHFLCAKQDSEVPANLKNLIFSKFNCLRMQIMGNLLAPTKDAWKKCSGPWLYFLDVRGMTVHGSGVINGQGRDWWGKALLFQRCDGLQISGLTHINGPGSHIFVVHSQDITISNIDIYSPLESHNTDGIDLTNSVRVNIRDSIIRTGDDCIAMKGGSKFININNVTCGPGHGIRYSSKCELYKYSQ
ncbi:Putative polygalacturonase [Glycine soja]|uniref:Putative polygalacturonase n=1 Tax=Glycine soja TaxID=3848 RepID=A0A0B2RNN6_GLYSO|nr:Putative polygalacturonase [Glycine soja]